MILCADNLRITNKKIYNALLNMDPLPIVEMVRKCEKRGAHAIDINSGPLTKNPEKQMEFLVETVQSVTDLPIIIDTANPKAIKAGLLANKKKAIINGFSLEPHKIELILPLSNEFEVDIIGYLLNPNGHVPSNAQERFTIALELFEIINNFGIDNKRVIIDPVLAPLMWDNGSFQAKEVLHVINNLSELLDHEVKTVVGLSNLAAGYFDPLKKQQVEAVYLSMLYSVGIDMVLLNIFNSNVVKIAKTCELITSSKIFSWEEI